MHLGRATFGALVLATLSCHRPTCPMNEPWGRRYTVPEVIAETAADGTSPLEGKEITVCGFIWHEYEEEALWENAEAFERLRTCLADAPTCVARKNKARLTLGGNLEKWRDWKGESACVNGMFRIAKHSSNANASPLELLARCVREP